MATVSDILTEKGTHVVSIGEDATALEAAFLMNEHKIGALCVVRDDVLVGMFTERDILQRVVAAQVNPAKLLIRDGMTSDITVCDRNTTVEGARLLMMNQRVRHLPVVDEGRKLSGMVSIGDMNAYQLADKVKTVNALQEYIHGTM